MVDAASGPARFPRKCAFRILEVSYIDIPPICLKAGVLRITHGALNRGWRFNVTLFDTFLQGLARVEQPLYKLLHVLRTGQAISPVLRHAADGVRSTTLQPALFTLAPSLRPWTTKEMSRRSSPLSSSGIEEKEWMKEPCSWIEEHKCWNGVQRWHPSGWKHEIILNIGLLGQLKQRAHCALCLQLYNLLKVEVDRTYGVGEELEVDQTMCRFAYIEGKDAVELHLGDNSEKIYFRLNPIGSPKSLFKHLDLTRIDSAHILEWLSHCDENHKICQKTRSRDLSRHKVVMVDVLGQCLVSTTLAVEYLALSYVWGGKTGLMLERANSWELSTPGSLRVHKEKIPTTIRDAMLLTAALNRRYLWVDTLCIVQDDTDNKKQQIQLMSSIYNGASITIVAADGSHANHGILGIGDADREPPHVVVTFSPSRKFVVDLVAVATTRHAPYYDRGWTYQEFYLSNRLVVFYRSSVLWRCHQNSKREGVSKLDSSNLILPGYVNDHNLLHSLDWPRFSSYATIAIEYNIRNLTYDTDALHAFTGILNKLKDAFSGGFLQALPELYFDIALLWRPALPLRRRLTTGDVYLPSWSWVGWAGLLDSDWMDVLEDPVFRGREHDQWDEIPITTLPITTWYKSSSISGERIRVDNSYYQYMKLRVVSVSTMGEQQIIDDTNDFDRIEKALGNCRACLDGWRLSRPTDDQNLSGPHRDRAVWRHPDLDGMFKYPVPMDKTPLPLESADMRFLHCRTHRTFLGLGSTNFWKEKQNSLLHVPVLDLDKAVVGVLSLPEAEHIEEKDRTYELISISRGYAGLTQRYMSLKQDIWLHEMSDLDCLLRIAQLTDIKAELRKELSSDELRRYIASLRQRIRYYEFYNVMWIERQEGIAYRKGIGRVFKKDWEGLAVEEIDVVLG